MSTSIHRSGQFFCTYIKNVSANEIDENFSTLPSLPSLSSIILVGLGIFMAYKLLNRQPTVPLNNGQALQRVRSD